MESHVLLKLAARFGTTEPVLDPYWYYDRGVGAWVVEADPDTLMVTPPKPDPKPSPKSPPKSPPPPPPPRPRPRSKKEDVETGEDMKGT